MLALILMLPILASAETIIRHSGATDPTLEGWATSGTGFPVLDDLGRPVGGGDHQRGPSIGSRLPLDHGGHDPSSRIGNRNDDGELA